MSHSVSVPLQKQIAILQSNYLPWKGYFDILHEVDEFILLDDVQYTTRDWRNRNKIKTANGLLWLTVPVSAKSHFTQKICDVAIEKETPWQKKHWRAIEHNYSKAPHFNRYKSYFEKIYIEQTWENLTELNVSLLRGISELLGFSPTIIDSREIPLELELSDEGRRTDRLVQICRARDATVYLSGPAAQDYIEHEKFQAENIELRFKDYSNYPEYPQRFGPFEHGVSVIDVLFNCGDKAEDYIWGWRNRT